MYRATAACLSSLPIKIDRQEQDTLYLWPLITLRHATGLLADLADEFAAQKDVFSFNKFNFLVSDGMEWVPVVLGCCHFSRRTTMLCRLI
jgi:hypothetical protein